MKAIHHSKIFFFIFVALLLTNFCISEGEKKNDEVVKELAYYLQDGNIQDFISLSGSARTEIFQKASSEDKNKLMELIHKNIYDAKVLEMSGHLAENAGEENKIGEENANYPKELKFIGMDNEKLVFGGEKGENIISDGKVHINLESISKAYNEIEYVEDNGEGKSAFILKGDNGLELTVLEGATNEKGEIKFLSSRGKTIGDQTFSENLEDYEMKGKVTINEEGFIFEGDESNVKYEEFEFGPAKGMKKGEVKFNDDGVDLVGCYLFKGGEFAVKPTKMDEPFKVVFGSDWSAFLGKEYPKSITFTDAGTVIDPLEVQTVGQGYYETGGPDNPRDVNYGEIKVLPGDDGSVYRFQKNGAVIDLRHFNGDLDKLKSSSVYRGSSDTMKTIMSDIVKDGSNGNMQFLQSKLFNSNRIVHENKELYKSFLTTANLADAPTGIAISSRSDGKIDVFANSKGDGGQLIFYKNVGMMSVNSMSKDSTGSPLKINVNPSEGKSMDYEIFGSSINRVGGPEKFEFGIDEIRHLNNDGTFGHSAPDLRVNSIQEGKDGNYALKVGERVTVLNGNFNFMANSLMLNNGEMQMAEMGLPVEKYLDEVENVLDEVKKSKGDVKRVADLLRDVNTYYSVATDPNIRAELEKKINSQLKSIRESSNVPASVKDKLPESISVPSPFFVNLGITGGEFITEKFRKGLVEDLNQLRSNPVVGDVKMTVDVNDVRGFDTENVENFASSMEKSDFSVDIGVRMPELKSVKVLEENVLFEQSVKKAEEGLGNVRRELLKNTLTETFFQGIVGRSVPLGPSNTLEISWMFDRSTPSGDIKLRQNYVDDISSAITTAVSEVSLTGETQLKITNLPNKNTVSVSLVSGGKPIPLNLDKSTNQFIHDEVIMGLNAPSQLKGYYDRPWSPFNINNAPVLPNGAVSTFCRSVGYSSGFCDEKTSDRAKAFLGDKYFMR